MRGKSQKRSSTPLGLLWARRNAWREDEGPGRSIASAIFPDERAAHDAAHRLVGGGFAPRRVSVTRLFNTGEAHEVMVETAAGNLRRAEDLLHGRREVHPMTPNDVDVRPLFILAGIAALAAIGYSIYALRSQPRRDDPELHLPGVW